MNNLNITPNQIAETICINHRLPLLTFDQLTIFLQRVCRVYNLTSANSIDYICECAALYLRTPFGKNALMQIVNNV